MVGGVWVGVCGVRLVWHHDRSLLWVKLPCDLPFFISLAVVVCSSSSMKGGRHSSDGSNKRPNDIFVVVYVLGVVGTRVVVTRVVGTRRS